MSSESELTQATFKPRSLPSDNAGGSTRPVPRETHDAGPPAIRQAVFDHLAPEWSSEWAITAERFFTALAETGQHHRAGMFWEMWMLVSYMQHAGSGLPPPGDCLTSPQVGYHDLATIDQNPRPRERLKLLKDNLRDLIGAIEYRTGPNYTVKHALLCDLFRLVERPRDREAYLRAMLGMRLLEEGREAENGPAALTLWHHRFAEFTRHLLQLQRS